MDIPDQTAKAQYNAFVAGRIPHPVDDIRYHYITIIPAKIFPDIDILSNN